jgi:hypothetical protein
MTAQQLVASVLPAMTMQQLAECVLPAMTTQQLVTYNLPAMTMQQLLRCNRSSDIDDATDVLCSNHLISTMQKKSVLFLISLLYMSAECAPLWSISDFVKNGVRIVR